MKACLFTRVPDKSLFETVGFYKNDICIFTDLGFQVTQTNVLSEVPWDCDLYISWFPYWGALILPIASIKNKPHITIGTVDAAIPKQVRKRGWRQYLLLLMEKIAVRYATISLPTSFYEESFFMQLGAYRVKMIYHAVETDRYTHNSNEVTKKHNKQILTITHINEANYRRKCIGTIIESIPHIVRNHPEVRFIFIGRQDQEVMSRIKRQLKELGIEHHVLFVGQVNHKQKLKYLQESAVYLQPSLHEGFGMAIAEAMSCGLAVVTSPVGSVPEVVGDIALFSPGKDPLKLAKQVSHLLAEPELCKRLGEQGRKRICTRFFYEKRRAEIAQVVEDVMNEAGIPIESQVLQNITRFKREVS